MSAATIHVYSNAANDAVRSIWQWYDPP